jgi:hypothetical protein
MRPPSAASLSCSVRFHRQHGAGVQAFFHLHDGHAGLRVAGLDGTVDRRSAAPARQQRAVDINAGFDVEGALGQDQAVGCDDHYVVLE